MDKPTIESMNVEEVKAELDGITEETTKEELYKKIDFFVKQMNLCYEQNRKNMLVMTEALEQAQSKYKAYEVNKGSFKERAKLYLKKVLIAWGWYEASYDELKELHFGKSGNAVSTKSS